MGKPKAEGAGANESKLSEWLIAFSLDGYEHHRTKSRHTHLQTATARAAC
jgi:hypothetical protein